MENEEIYGEEVQDLIKELVHELSTHRNKMGKIEASPYPNNIKLITLDLIKKGVPKRELEKLTKLHYVTFQHWEKQYKENKIPLIKEITVVPEIKNQLKNELENKLIDHKIKIKKQRIKIILPSKAKIFISEELVLQYLNKIFS